ncbi:hypothetical protein YC2023_017186 [Brassica napus]
MQLLQATNCQQIWKNLEADKSSSTSDKILLKLNDHTSPTCLTLSKPNSNSSAENQEHHPDNRGKHQRDWLWGHFLVESVYVVLSWMKRRTFRLRNTRDAVERVKLMLKLKRLV